MDGRPVWLASISKRNEADRVVSALKYPPVMQRAAQRELEAVLAGVGDTTRERGFQMCITQCVHRALTDAEADALPASWADAPALDIAGGPVRVLYTKGIREIPSTMPCENFTKQQIGYDADNEPLWVPMECGRCLPCEARRRI